MIAQPSQSLRRRPRAGFTLIEIITVVVIIVVLMAIALPALNIARKKAMITHTASNLVAISTAIEAYKSDFRDFPRPEGPYVGWAMLTKTMFSPGPSVGPIPPQPLPVQNHPVGTVTSAGKPGDPEYREYVGFGIPDPSGGFTTTTQPPDNKQWAVFPVSDGKDGAGFRARPGGQPYNAYLQDSKFHVRGMAILDMWDNPILYFAARPAKPAPAANGEWPLLPLTAAAGDAAFYNAFHNISFFMRPGQDDVTNVQHCTNARKRIEALLVVPGDNDFDGVMETSGGRNERAATDKAFLLWSAGPNGKFGPDYDTNANPTADDIRKVDDVTNFTTGQ